MSPPGPTGKERLAALLAANGVAPAPSRPAQPRPGTSSAQLRARAASSRRDGAGGEGEGRGSLDYGAPGVVRGAAEPGASFVQGDSGVVMGSLPAASVDLVFTDPGIGDQSWDSGVPEALFWAQMFRVLKPGGYLAFFSSRKYGHRALTRAEDAGFEPVDTLLWVYPRGMPTGLDLGQATAKKTGGSKTQYFRTIGSMTDEQRQEFLGARGNPWDGWSTELRPTWEPIPILQKPREGSYADNLLTHGVGGMNIDATRIPTEGRDAIATYIPEGQGDAHGLALTKYQQVVGETTLGRWPADAIFSHAEGCVVGQCVPGCAVEGLADEAKLFYCTKPDRREKDLGLSAKENQIKGVKPIEVCRWVLQLLCPPNGTVLDPFCGAGSIALGGIRLDGTGDQWAPPGIRLAGRSYLGIDIDPAAIDLAERRYAAYARTSLSS